MGFNDFLKYYSLITTILFKVFFSKILFLVKSSEFEKLTRPEIF